MKISKLEALTLAAAAVVLIFSLGWFLRGTLEARPVTVETTRSLRAEEAKVSLSAPTAAPKIDLNTADAETLQTLPGIGEKRAADIIAYRAANGPFRYPEDLTKVPGIGESTLEGLIDLIMVKEER